MTNAYPEIDPDFRNVREAIDRQWYPGGWIGHPEFALAPHVQCGEYGIGPIGLESQNGNRDHSEWWQFISRPLQENSDCDPWRNPKADYQIAGNRDAMMRDLALLLLSDFRLAEWGSQAKERPSPANGDAP